MLMPLAFKGYQIRKHVFSFIGKTKMLAYIVHTADHERHNSDKGMVYGVRPRITHPKPIFFVTTKALMSAMFGPKS